MKEQINICSLCYNVLILESELISCYQKLCDLFNVNYFTSLIGYPKRIYNENANVVLLLINISKIVTKSYFPNIHFEIIFGASLVISKLYESQEIYEGSSDDEYENYKDENSINKSKLSQTQNITIMKKAKNNSFILPRYCNVAKSPSILRNVSKLIEKSQSPKSLKSGNLPTSYFFDVNFNKLYYIYNHKNLFENSQNTVN